MAKSFNPLLFDSLNVGKHIKSSKKRFMWKFELDGKEHVIDLFVSKISGKRKLLLNGDIKLEARRSSSYGSYPLRIGSHSLLLYEMEDNVFDLRCDNISFEAALMRNRSKSDFSADFRNRETRDDPFSRGGYNEPKPDHFRTRVEANDPYRSRNEFNPEPYKSSARWEQEEPAYKPSRVDQFKAEWEENKKWERRENDEYEHPKVRPNRRPSPDPLPSRYSAPPKPERTAPQVTQPKVQETKPEPKPEPMPQPLDLFDTPSVPSNLPDDLFTKPLQSSGNQNQLGNPYSMTSNPFESDPSTEDSPFSFKQEPQEQPQQPQQPQKEVFENFIDLDNLHLGDGYSPAVARKMQEANKPITINSPNVPNVPINQLQTNRPSQAPMGMQTGMPGMQTGMPGMNPMNPMNNPMAAMMAYNQFMTGMMMNPYMNPQQPYPK